MQTTCPECRTTFRVSQDDLGARRGLVRCGHCNAVFNAYDTLLPELASPPEDDVAAVSQPKASPKPEQPRVETIRVKPEAQSPLQADHTEAPTLDYSIQSRHDAYPAGKVEVVEDVVEKVDHFKRPEVFAAPELAADHSESPVADLVEAKPQSNILFEPLWAKSAKQPRTWKFWLYVFLSVLLAGFLVLQTVYFLRAELVAAVPNTRPMLERLCQPLNCVVPLPRQLTQDAIVASSLEHDPENKSRVRLTFLLVNRTGQTQTWPQITLTLSDMREAPVAQQVFPPHSYLPNNVKPNAGMAPGTEREFRLDLDIGNLVASGYTIGLGYP